MRAVYNAALGIAALRPRPERRDSEIVARHTEQLVDHVRAGRMGHATAVAALADLGLPLDRITSLLEDVDVDVRHCSAESRS